MSARHFDRRSQASDRGTPAPIWRGMNVLSMGPEDVHAKQHAAMDAGEKRHGKRHSPEHVELTTILLTSRTDGRLRLSYIVYIAN